MAGLRMVDCKVQQKEQRATQFSFARSFYFSFATLLPSASSAQFSWQVAPTGEKYVEMNATGGDPVTGNPRSSIVQLFCGQLGKNVKCAASCAILFVERAVLNKLS